MKKLYRKFLRFFTKIPIIIEIIKSFFAEWIAIFKKAPLYKHIKWTKEQQREFDNFWKENYGKKISNRWHRLYEACNGVHKIDYFPEYLYSTKLERKFNDFSYSKVFSNKSLIDVLFNNRVENVRTPEYFIFNDNGIFYDKNRNIISLNRALEILKDVGEAVIKPTVDTSSGSGVAILNIKEGIDIRNNQTVENILLNYSSNFIVQEKLKPCKNLELLYPKAINTIRAITYIIDDEIEIAPLNLRIGGGGGEVDNIHAGGMVIAVDNEGNLSKFAYRLGWGDNFQKFDKHPDTNIVFENYNLDFIPQVIKVAKKLHTYVSNIGIISWDFTVDYDGNIVVVEANYSGQSVWFPQMISGKSFFGNDTVKILKFLEKKSK